MVAFAIPNVPRRLFASDGCWHTTSFWRDSLAVLCEPDIVAAATSGLLSVFDPQWAAAIPDHPHAPHPFESWYGLGGGVPRLARLGYCLHRVDGLPEKLRARLLNPAEFDGAEAEVRAAALFAQLGASIVWNVDSTTRGVEFEAAWSEHRVPVEVEQLGDGDLDRDFGAIDAAFERGLSKGLLASLRTSTTSLASRALLAPLVDELAPLVEAEVEAEERQALARRLGESYGARWGTIAAKAEGPGRHESPGLVVEILREGQGHQWEAATLAPGAQVDFARLARNCSRHANQQVAATGLVGVAILERRWPPTWSAPVIELVGRALSRDRFPSLGAVMMREAARDSEASRTAEIVHVLPGAQWSELPAELRERLPPGSHRVELLPERALPGAKERRDDQDAARASTPAARLAEAFALMRLGYRMRWSRLRREHPSASTEELQTMMSKWSLADA